MKHAIAPASNATLYKVVLPQQVENVTSGQFILMNDYWCICIQFIPTKGLYPHTPLIHAYVYSLIDEYVCN
jgi:hypothetical protein